MYILSSSFCNGVQSMQLVKFVILLVVYLFYLYCEKGFLLVGYFSSDSSLLFSP
jgi:hypothetical protein